ncbi:PRO [Gryllus bimaculatus]|nr:PRO [Gryllus bimaculatus]
MKLDGNLEGGKLPLMISPSWNEVLERTQQDTAIWRGVLPSSSLLLMLAPAAMRNSSHNLVSRELDWRLSHDDGSFLWMICDIKMILSAGAGNRQECSSTGLWCERIHGGLQWASSKGFFTGDVRELSDRQGGSQVICEKFVKSEIQEAMVEHEKKVPPTLLESLPIVGSSVNFNFNNLFGDTVMVRTVCTTKTTRACRSGPPDGALRSARRRTKRVRALSGGSDGNSLPSEVITPSPSAMGRGILRGRCISGPCRKRGSGVRRRRRATEGERKKYRVERSRMRKCFVTVLKIPHFRGVFMRDELPRKPRAERECGDVNLDDVSGDGTHFVAYRLSVISDTMMEESDGGSTICVATFERKGLAIFKHLSAIVQLANTSWLKARKVETERFLRKRGGACSTLLAAIDQDFNEHPGAARASVINRDIRSLALRVPSHTAKN